MLALTDAAAEAIGELTVQPNLPDTAGLRISARPEGVDGAAWSARLATEPAPQDQVVEAPKGRVFLDPLAADRLDDTVLDAERVDEGEFVFHLTQRPT